MEMNQLQTILHSLTFQKIECFEQLTGSQAELAGISSRLFPLSATGRSEFDTDTDVGFHIQLFCHLRYQLKLVHLLHNEEDTFTHFLGKQSQLYITFVFITIADNQ